MRKWNRRDIDGDAKVSRPSCCGGACLPDDPLPQRDNKADLFRQRNECGGSDHSLRWMVPAKQGLESADFIAHQIDDRLIVEFELASGQRLAQLLFQDAAGLPLQNHPGPKKEECAAALALRPV